MFILIINILSVLPTEIYHILGFTVVRLLPTFACSFIKHITKLTHGAGHHIAAFLTGVTVGRADWKSRHKVIGLYQDGSRDMFL